MEMDVSLALLQVKRTGPGAPLQTQTPWSLEDWSWCSTGSGSGSGVAASTTATGPNSNRSRVTSLYQGVCRFKQNAMHKQNDNVQNIKNVIIKYEFQKSPNNSKRIWDSLTQDNVQNI